MPEPLPDLNYHDHITHYQLDGEYYDFFSPDKYMLQEIRRRYQEFFHLYRVNRHHRILELGSGGGFAVDVLKKWSPFFYLVDIPINNLKKIKQQAAFPLFPAAADAYSLPFKKDSFHLVFMAEVLEHLFDPAKVLREIHRVLRPDGNLLFSVPYKEKITYQICIHCNQPTPTHSHLHSFDEKKLKELLIQAGFQPIRFSKNCNKIPNRLHINYLFRNLPFPFWKIMDHFFNFWFDKPISIIGLARKQSH